MFIHWMTYPSKNVPWKCDLQGFLAKHLMFSHTSSGDGFWNFSDALTILIWPQYVQYDQPHTIHVWYNIVYLPIHDFYGIHVGKYTICMDGMGTNPSSTDRHLPTCHHLPFPQWPCRKFPCLHCRWETAKQLPWCFTQRDKRTRKVNAEARLKHVKWVILWVSCLVKP